MFSTTAETYEELSTELVEQTLIDLKTLSTLLSDINGRRNTVVHSAYFDLKQMNRDGRGNHTILSASKPNRKALELTEDFNPFGDIHGEIEPVSIEECKFAADSRGRV